MPGPNLTVEDRSGIHVVTLNDASILEAALIDTLCRKLNDLVDQQAVPRMILDFSKVEFLSSRSLGALVNLNKKCQQRKGSFAVCGLRPELLKVLTVTNLDKVVRIQPDAAEALRAMSPAT